VKPPVDFRHDVADWVLAMPVAAALGFSFVELGNGYSETRLRWRPEHSHAPGVFQAGPIGSLADFTGASAGITVLPTGSLAATVDYTVKLLAEARGDELVGRGRVLRPGTTLTVIAVDIHAVREGSESLCASAFVTIRAIAASTPRIEESV
jgi:uncharacterized protein (TIGR00369 family)